MKVGIQKSRKSLRQWISYFLVVGQLLLNANTGMAAMTVDAAWFETVKAAAINGIPGLTPTAAGFAKTPVGKAVDTLMAASGRVTENGAYVVDVVKNGTEVVGQAALAAPTKKNVVKYLRSKLKAAKNSGVGQFILSLPGEGFVFFYAMATMSKMQLWLDYADNPVSWEQHIMGHNPNTAEGQLGWASIGAFMATSKGSEHVLYKLIGDSPRGRFFTPLVPYAGMSLGLLASTIFHELSNLPELKACVASLEQRIADEEKWAQCERAYDSFSELGYEKLQALAPTLFAMITSTLIAGYAETMTVRKVFTMFGWQILWEHKADIVKEVAPLTTPAGWGIRGARLLYKVSQFVGQTLVQNGIEPIFTTWWNNFRRGNDLAELETDIMNQLDRKKRISWDQPFERKFGDLNLSLAKLSQYSMDWRKGNLHYPLIRHQNWMQFLMHFSSMYTASMNFYKDFVNEYRQRYILKNPSKLNELYPLSGIDPLVPQNAPSNPDELNNKKDFENMQLAQLIQARKEMEELIAKNEAAFKKQFPGTLDEFKKTLQLLPTEADYQAGKIRNGDISTAINRVNAKLNIKFDPGAPFYLMENQSLQNWIEAQKSEIQMIAMDPGLSKAEKEKAITKIKTGMIERIDANNRNQSKDYPDDRELYSYLRKLLYNPLPINIEGYGYLKAYQIANDEKGLFAVSFPKTERITDELNNKGINNFYSGLNWTAQALGFIPEHTMAFTSQDNTIVYHHPVQYMAGQIAFGPRADLKQSLVEYSRSGFPVTFRLPRLIESFHYDILLNETAKVTEDSKATIFNTPIIASGMGKSYKYKNIYQLISSPNLLPGIINHKDGLIGWWVDHVESQYAKAWEKFEEEYQDIMVQIFQQYKYYYKGYHSINPDDYAATFIKSGFSSGAPLSNGLQWSFRQERRLYLLILGEILKDHSDKIDKKNPLLTLGAANEAIREKFLSLKSHSVSAPKDIDLVNYQCEKLATHEKSVCEKNRKAFYEVQKRINDGGLPGLEVLRGNSAHLWPQYDTQFIPILDHLKFSENYSYSDILRSYRSGDIIPTKDEFSKNKFQFQQRIELSFQRLEWFLDQIKLEVVEDGNYHIDTEYQGSVNLAKTRKILVSNVNNSQFREAQNQIEDELEKLKNQFKNLFRSVNPNVLPVVWSCYKGLLSIAQQTAELGRMINAVSYEKSDEKEQSRGKTICDTNSMVTHKMGAATHTPYTKKVCKNQKTETYKEFTSPTADTLANPNATTLGGARKALGTMNPEAAFNPAALPLPPVNGEFSIQIANPAKAENQPLDLKAPVQEHNTKDEAPDLGDNDEDSADGTRVVIIKDDKN